MNPALARLLGYDSPREAIDSITNIAEQIYASPPERDAVAKAAMEAGGHINSVTHYRRKDGAPWYGMLHLRIASDPQGRPIHYEGFVEDITHRKLTEDALREVEKSLLALLAEKDMLLKEVHHRVKNNLAVVMGLLEMKGQSLANEPARIALAELSGRIKSMAMIHEQLYRSEAFSRIDFQIYLEELCAYLRSSYHLSGDISVCVSAMGVVMGLDIAVPCGLLITELVTNAFKYAFPADRQPEAGCKIDISVQWNGSAYTLAVADNGVGLPAGLDWSNTKTMGLVLVKLLGQHQLQGRIEVDCTGGTTFRLRFAPRKG